MAGLMLQPTPLVGTGGVGLKGGTLAGAGAGTSTARSATKIGDSGLTTAATADSGKAATGPATPQAKLGKDPTTTLGSQIGAGNGLASGLNGADDPNDDGSLADAGGFGVGGSLGAAADGSGGGLKTFAASLGGDASSSATAGQMAAALAAARSAAELTPPTGTAQAGLATAASAIGGVSGSGDGNSSGGAGQAGGGSNSAQSGVTSQEGDLSALAGMSGPQATDGQDFASQLTAVRGARTNLPTGATDQVTAQIQRSVKDGDGSITMQLRPEELGRIDIKLNIDKDGGVNATITADRPQTLELLQRDSHSLERALQDAGLQTNSDSLNFGLRGDGGQGYSQQQQQQQQQYQGDSSSNGAGGSQRRGLRGVGATEDDTTANTMVMLRRYQAAPGRVDVRI